jgi:hypothetical protein
MIKPFSKLNSVFQTMFASFLDHFRDSRHNDTGRDTAAPSRRHPVIVLTSSVASDGLELRILLPPISCVLGLQACTPAEI